VSGEFLALDLAELRRRLEEHKATRPVDLFGKEMQTWMKTKDRLLFAIELKEAEASQKPFFITVPPQPIEHPVQPLLRLRQAKSSSTQEVRHADSPGKAGAPGALLSEVPMPRANPASHHNPQARVEHLTERIKAAAQKGEKCYWAQQEIRDLCRAHGLEVPSEAIGRRTKGPGAAPQPVDEPLGSPHSPSTVFGDKTTVEVWVVGLKRWQLNGPLSSEHLNGLPRALLANLLLLEGQQAPSEVWRQFAQNLSLLEATAGAARQIAEHHAEVA